MKQRVFKALFLCIFCLSCTKKITTIKTTRTVPEEPYCTLRATFSDSVTITGTATFARRLPVSGTGLGSITTGNAIRLAEIRVINSSGSIIQCSETDTSGNFSLNLPRDSATYTLQVNARSFTTNLKASVLQDPNKNQLYSLSTTLTPDSSKSIGTIEASADETQDSELKGGAFNILDQIYRANNYLTSNSTFSVSEKVTIYWKRGVTPAVYANGSDTTPVSYYVPGTDAMYIQGGIQGDVCISDTDHFDNSVIIHEYGHFIEDNYSKTDSPGGAHDGITQVDPRLAWSEGFADFFSSLVLGNSSYIDTTGRPGSGCSTGIGYEYNMETNTPALDTIQATDAFYPSNLGEGIYREWAVARILWDALDTTTDGGNDSVSMPFSEFWNVYTGNFKTQKPFRDMGSFLHYQSTAGGATNIASLLTSTTSSIQGRMEANRRHYAEENLAGGTCSYTIRARDQTTRVENGTFANTNWFYSNDFYWVNHPGGTLTVSLSYTPDPSTPRKVDLDLYLYIEDYTFATDSDVIASSTRDNGFNSLGNPISSNDGGNESISVNVAAGNYMVNVHYFTGDGKEAGNFNATTYSITINGVTYCEP